tara:strand:- start:386 stop:1294 length:909 start_codon:yes stop_codon:yes gene_type:complete
MAISRSQLAKELEPGLNALFGLEYDKYDKEHLDIFDVESSDRAFEEEVMLAGFGNAETKPEGAGVNYDTAQEAWTARYNHETIALAFAITEEAVEDNLYDKLAGRYTKALARSMNNAKQIKGANVLNNGFSSSYTGGDGKELLATDHPTVTGGDFKNELTTAADLNETSLEQALVDLADMIDERGLKVAVKATKMLIPSELVFVAERLLQSQLRTGTADNDINAVRSSGMVPGGYVVNHYLTDSDAWFLKTDAPNGLKVFERSPLKTSMEGDFDTGNMRYKARERYSFGWSDPRGIFGSPGA